MKLNNSQALVKEFCIQNKLNTTVQVNIMDLVSEIGEVSKEFLKATN
ncbi:MAG TPA: hypothetical protein PLJ21_05800 [Pseudobdellovibrionaceae bacterium]|nr:hypothetical protein [Pseudobdellovibrionaceae bacterium]